MSLSPRRFLFLIALMLLPLGPVAAVEPGEALADAALETRARAISQHLRCLVCQNESIDDSKADLARDLRLLVRERLKEGDSDEAVVAFVQARYGDFVLLKPPLRAGTILLWVTPLLFLSAGLFLLRQHFRSRQNLPETKALSEAERREIEKIIGKEAP